MDLPFASGEVRLEFSAGRVSSIVLRGTSMSDASDAIAKKYGAPSEHYKRVKSSWAATREPWRKAAQRAVWLLNGGKLVLENLPASGVTISYVSADHAADDNY